MAAGDRDIFWLPQQLLARMQERVENGELVSEAEVILLVRPDLLPLNTVLIPVDLRGAGGVSGGTFTSFDKLDAWIRHKGPQQAAEALIAARAYFEANHDLEPEDQDGGLGLPLIVPSWPTGLGFIAVNQSSVALRRTSPSQDCMSGKPIGLPIR